MKVTIKLCACALALTALTACGGANENVSDSLFPIKDYTELQGEQISEDILMKQPRTLLIVEDKLLINDRQADSLMHVVDLKDTDRFWRIAPSGQGPNDFLYLGNLQYDGNELMVSDFQRGKFLYYRIEGGDIALDEAHLTHHDDFRTSGNVKAFGKGYVNSIPYEDKAMTLLDTEGKAVGGFAEYPGDTIGYHKDNNISFTLRKGWNAEISPRRDKLVISGTTSDWLAFYRLNAAGEPEKVKEYFSFETERDFIAEYNGDQLTMFGVDSNDKTMITFDASYATDDHYYVTYKGKLAKEEAKPSDTCYLLQFSWDGKLQKAYLLHEMIGTFAVDEEHHTLYAIYTPQGEDPMLWRYSLK